MTCRRSGPESISVDEPFVDGEYLPREAASAGRDLQRSTSHSAEEWAEIRPRFEYLYVALDMTLRDCMTKMEQEYGFSARYKKRIKAWKIAKSVKAKHKDAVIAELARIAAAGKRSAITTRRPIRHDKLIRHAQARLKAGLLEPELLQRLQSYTEVVSVSASDSASSDVVTHNSQDSPNSTFSLPYHTSLSATSISTSTTTTSSPPPTLPSPLAKFDLFLRALHSVIDREHHEWLSPSTSHLNPSAIVSTFTQGLHHWSRADYSKARILFSAAAENFVADLQSPEGPRFTRMTYFVGGLVWPQISNPAALQFREFMVRAVREILGRGNVLEVLFEGLSAAHDFEMQETVWTVAMGQYLKAGKPEQLFGMARQRWLYCLENGMVDLAWVYREHACGSFEGLGLLTEEMVKTADEDFGVLPKRLGSVEVLSERGKCIELL